MLIPAPAKNSPTRAISGVGSGREQCSAGSRNERTAGQQHPLAESIPKSLAHHAADEHRSGKYARRCTAERRRCAEPTFDVQRTPVLDGVLDKERGSAQRGQERQSAEAWHWSGGTSRLRSE